MDIPVQFLEKTEHKPPSRGYQRGADYFGDSDHA